VRPWPTNPFDHRPTRSLRRPFLSVAALAVLWLAGTAVAQRQQPGDEKLYLGDQPILVTDVTSSEAHISPPDSCHFSGDQVQDRSDVRFRVIWPESVDVYLYVYETNGNILGFVEPPRRRAPRQQYLVPFIGCVASGTIGRPLPDGFYNLVVRAVDDTGRIEDTFLPIEVDRVLPIVVSSETNKAAYQNGDTVVLEMEMDRPGYTLAPNFEPLDSDPDPNSTTISDHGDGRYTIRHTISENNTRADNPAVPIRITIRDLAGNTRVDRSQFVCLSNHPPELVFSRIINPSGAYKDGDVIRIETRWNSTSTPLRIEADFGNIDSDYDSSLVEVTTLANNAFELAYPISTDNERPDHPDYRISVRASDTACGTTVDTSIVVGLDNSLPPQPRVDALPATTRSGVFRFSGQATGAVRVVVRRGTTAIDTAQVDEAGRFETDVSLLSGRNVLSFEAVNHVGSRSSAVAVEIFRLTDAFFTVPARFVAGESAFQLGLARAP
jgi:hypothetical protein